MKKRLAMLGTAAIAASMLAGMSVNAESIVTEPTELTFIFADGDEGAKSSMNEIVNRFNEAYPDITVTIEPGNGGAYSEFIKTKDSVGEFPDVMERYRALCACRQAGSAAGGYCKPV